MTDREWGVGCAELSNRGREYDHARSKVKTEQACCNSFRVFDPYPDDFSNHRDLIAVSFSHPSLLQGGREGGVSWPSLLPLVLRLGLGLRHPLRELPSWWWRQRREVPVALVAISHVPRSYVRRGGVRLGVLRNTEAACGHRGYFQVRAAWRGRIGRIVGESDCALFCTGYGLKSRASKCSGREEKGREVAWTDGDHEARRSHEY